MTEKGSTPFSVRSGTRTIEIRALMARMEAILRPKPIHDIFCEMWDFTIEIRAVVARLKAVYDRKKDPRHFLLDVGLVRSKSGLSLHV